jgi:hypothetical protein
MDLPKLWALVEADLVRARSTLPDEAASNKVICMYQDFLDHNEVELACDILEEYSKEHQVSREFWLALHDAAIKMQLPKAKRYVLALLRTQPRFPAYFFDCGGVDGTRFNRRDRICDRLERHPGLNVSFRQECVTKILATHSGSRSGISRLRRASA